MEQTHLQLLQPVLTFGRLALLAFGLFDLAVGVPGSILLSGRPLHRSQSINPSSHSRSAGCKHFGFSTRFVSDVLVLARDA
jgi:hypothetical protein